MSKNLMEGVEMDVSGEHAPITLTLRLPHELAKMLRLALEEDCTGAPDVVVTRLKREIARQLGNVC